MVATRLQGIAPTVFGEMSALAARTGAINLGQGFPDADGPPALLQAASQAIADGANQYAPGLGVPALREAIARHQHRHYGLTFDPATEIVVTTGCTEAIAASVLGLIEPGDEVVVLEPFYDSYVAMLQMVGAVRRPVTLRWPDFALDGDALRAAVTQRTRFILLNSPHNPTGTVLRPDELALVAEVAIEHDLIVIADEVYEHLTYDGVTHVPIASLPGMRDRTLTLSSAGKSYSVTGWKVGWAVGPTALVEAVVAAKQWLTYTSGSSYQPAVAHALDHCGDFPRQLAASLSSRRDLLCDGLDAIGLPTRRPDGTYFGVSDVSDLGWEDGRAFCLALPERAGVVAIPLQGFYDGDAGRHLVRWAFCKQEPVLREAISRLKAVRLAR